MSTTLSAADRLVSHLDRDWAHTRSSIRSRVQQTRYNPLFSWEGRSDDPRSFTKLEVTTYPSAPLCMSGAAVIELDRSIEDISLFNGFSEDAKRLNGTGFALTKEQRDLAMQTDLSGEIPLRTLARSTDAALLTRERVRFQNQRMRSPRYETAPPPLNHNPLLHPHQLRAIGDLEAQERAAAADVRVAVKQRMRTKALVVDAFRRGILSVDSSSNQSSAVYGDRARAAQDWESRRQRHEDGRREQLTRATSSLLLHGNLLSPDTMPASVRTEPAFQSKRLSTSTLSFAETHARLFDRSERMFSLPSAKRTQHLRDQDLAGRQHCFVTHTQIDVWPSLPSFQRQERKDLAHPSQASLEGVRNLQGAL